MAQVPMPRIIGSGLSQAITNQTDTDPVDAPAGARGVMIWFVDANGDFVEGRVGFSSDQSVAIESITATSLAYHPPMPVYYDLNRYVSNARAHPLYIHLACDTAGAVAKGSFYY